AEQVRVELHVWRGVIGEVLDRADQLGIEGGPARVAVSLGETAGAAGLVAQTVLVVEVPAARGARGVHDGPAVRRARAVEGLRAALVARTGSRERCRSPRRPGR